VLLVISLVISDVDGTLVTRDKQLTPATLRAAQLLSARDIGFAVVSSRPPIGMRMLVEPLSLQLPIGTFSGGATVTPTLEVMEQHFLPESAVRKSVEILAAFSADVWLYATNLWLVRDANGPYVALERRTIQAEPMAVADFDPYFARASKIVGSSENFAKLAQCETVLREALGEQASVSRSQLYYLDVTPARFDKGTFVEALAKRLAVPLQDVAVLGDGENDLAMFGRAGMSIAMGNASAEVKRRANYVAASNEDDGFAKAIEQHILNGAR
jgi:Cof subfamily protein (haloacid dehalogenase superfamily)